MYIPDFNYFKPTSLKEAIQLLNSENDLAPLAGGTDLLVEIKKGLRHQEGLVSLNNIDELKMISENTNEVFIGAGVTHNELLFSDIIQSRFPAISKTVSKIGTEQIRNKGTVGGNLCTAASCCDLGPILLALGANVEIVNATGSKTVALKDFFVFHRKTILKKGELVTRVTVPFTEKGTGVQYEKFGLREASAVAVASVAAMVKIRDNICDDACIVIGAVAPTPRISAGSIKHIKGKNIDLITESSKILDEAGNAAAEDAIPIDDIRSGAPYRRDLIRTLTRRAILKAIDQAQLNL